MAGGQTIAPFVEKLITEYFGREIKVDRRDNPMESVAVGAAFVAFMRANDCVNQVELHDLPTNHKSDSSSDEDKFFEAA